VWIRNTLVAPCEAVCDLLRDALLHGCGTVTCGLPFHKLHALVIIIIIIDTPGYPGVC
jgi:hypothetical protein